MNISDAIVTQRSCYKNERITETYFNYIKETVDSVLDINQIKDKDNYIWTNLIIIPNPNLNHNPD